MLNLMFYEVEKCAFVLNCTRYVHEAQSAVHLLLVFYLVKVLITSCFIKHGQRFGQFIRWVESIFVPFMAMAIAVAAMSFIEINLY